MVIAVWFILILIWCLQYSQLGELSVGPISYSEDQNGNLLPLVICKSLYKKRSLEPLKQAFEIDTDLETGEKSTISLAHYIYIIIIINVVLWFKSVSLYLSLSFCVFFFFFFSLFVIWSKVCKTVENAEFVLFWSGFLQVCSHHSCFLLMQLKHVTCVLLLSCFPPSFMGSRM